MRSLCFALVVAPAALLVISCGAPQPHDTKDAVEKATGVHQCKVSKSVERPMLVEWPATEKAALHTNAAKGVVVVRYDGCRLKVLDHCKLDGGYDFMETPRSKDGFSIKDKTELFTKLPLGAVSLEGEISQGNTLSLSYVAVGTRTAEVGEVTAEKLSGSCEGATHYVRSMVVGAYELTSEKVVGGSAGVEVGSAGAGGSHEEQSEVLRSDGDLVACVDRATSAVDSGCQAIIQLVLDPISMPEPESAGPAAAPSQPASNKAGVKWIHSKPAGVRFTKTEITVDQYRACVNAGACSALGVTMPLWISYREMPNLAMYCNWDKGDRGDHPMNCIDWSQAGDVCAWLGGRLPTEDEWYAEASNGGSRKYPWGDQEATCAYAIFAESNADGCGKNRTWPVCSRTQGNSVSGLCDMSGNVWEWTSTKSSEAKDACVIRGGMWLSRTPDSLYASSSHWEVPYTRARFVGVRCVRSTQ